MSQDEARSGSRAVPVALGCRRRLYRFWSSQIDSLTELASGSSVSTLTAFAMTSVVTFAEVPGPPLPLPLPLPPHAAAMAVSEIKPTMLRNRDGVALTMSHSIRRLSTTPQL